MTSDEFALVMDDPTMRRACFLYILEDMGWEPGRKLNGIDALEASRRIRALNGDQVIEAIQQWSPFLTILHGMT